MTEVGYSWGDWNVIDAETILTQGGTIFDISAEQDLSNKVAALVSIDVDYSNHAKATAGLSISILRDIDDTVYESVKGAAVSVEMPFTQAGTERKTFFLSAGEFQKFVLRMDWGNTTGSSVATIATAIKFATLATI